MNETEKFSGNVFASADVALAHGGEKVTILGHLIWYSIKESRIRPLDLRRLFIQIGIPTDFLPDDPSPINAFKRATTELNEGIEVKLEDNKTAIYMVRLIYKSEMEIAKSIIKEVRDSSNKRLSYEEIGRVHFDKDTKDVRYFDTHPDSQQVITRIKQLFEMYSEYITGKQIRAMLYDISRACLQPLSARAEPSISSPTRMRTWFRSWRFCRKSLLSLASLIFGLLSRAYLS